VVALALALVALGLLGGCRDDGTIVRQLPTTTSSAPMVRN
jgi:hypothetical protein